MPWFVNKQLVPEELIRQEEEVIARHPGWLRIADEAERARQIRDATLRSAQNKILVAQAAAADPRPIEAWLIAQRLPEFRRANGNRALDDAAARKVLEQELRMQRFAYEAAAAAPEPTAEQIEAFYRNNPGNFLGPERFRASHIVKHVTETQTEEQARAAIAVALQELDRGEPFADAARRHSDCPDQGGEIPAFQRGEMVEQFEEVVCALQPGERTGIFRTPFGYHIAMLHERIAPSPAPLEDCRPDIKNTFSVQNQHQFLLRAVEQLRARADIRFVPDEPTSNSVP